MRKSMKKLVSFGLAAALTLTTMFSGNLDFMGTVVTEEAQAAASTADVVVPEKPLEFKDLTADELITQMGTGWNLGNTMDGHTGLTPNETQWQFVETTKSMIKAVHDMGFNTVRIPTTWGTMINDDFSINEKWMSRVEDIVDYCMEQDMYAIVNIHHDGADQSYWLNMTYEGTELDAMYTKFEGVWKTIATRFKNYDEHLIFESMNEIHSKDGWASSKADIDSDVAKINKLNQIFVNTVRATGSNNYDRWLLMPGWNTNIEAITDPKSTFKLPTDPNTEHQRLMVSVHDYDPWSVCGDTASSATSFNVDSLSTNYVSNFKMMHDQFVAKGIPVVIGEYGIIDKGNTVDREFYCEGVNRLLQQNKLVGVYWDDGGTEGKPFAIFDRKAEKTKNKVVTDALMRGYFLTGADKGTDIVRDAEVTPITSFDVNQTEKLDMTVNDSLEVTVSNIVPAVNNDVILWKTENPDVATVYNGKIRARGIGTTKVIAFTQSGSFSKEITIGVVAETLAAGSECTEIKTDVDSISINEGEKQFLSVDAMAGDQAFSGAVTYASSDESVATVSLSLIHI